MIGGVKMPFKSRYQEKWMWANHPEMAKRWEKETPAGRLPEHVKRAREAQAIVDKHHKRGK